MYKAHFLHFQFLRVFGVNIKKSIEMFGTILE